ncbi:MAG: general secretion pathway protein GspD, partial [Chitinophagaceae bacterium]
MLCFFAMVSVFGQNNAGERLKLIDERLRNLAVTVPGLNQKVQLSVSGASAQEFLRALAQSNNLNINIDPQLNFKVFNNFREETALNILLFLAKEYDLDINMIGSIMTVSKVPQPKVLLPPREIKVRYNSSSDALSMELNNDTLAFVARKITQLSQKNVVVPAALLNNKVTGFFSEAPFDVALEKLAYANSLKLTRTADNVYIFQALGEGEELYINGDKNTDVRRVPAQQRGGGNNVQGGGSFSLTSKKSPAGKLISVEATNAAIGDIIKSSTQEAGINYFIYSDLKG